MDMQFRSRTGVESRQGRRLSFAFWYPMVALIVCVCFGCSSHAGAAGLCPAIEVSAVTDAHTDWTRSAAVNSATSIPLDGTPLVTGGDVTDASASPAAGEWSLKVKVTDEAARRVHDFSAHHIGQKLALLVEGKVQGTPKIVDTVSTNVLQVGEFERADAERLATAIHNGCRR